MATVKAFIRTSSKREVKVRFRLSDGRNRQFFYTSHIMVLPEYWDSRKECIKARCVCPSADRSRVDEGVTAMKTMLLRIYEKNYHVINNTESLQRIVERELHPDGANDTNDFLGLFDTFITSRPIAYGTLRSYKVLRGKLARYAELRGPIPNVQAITADDVSDILCFIKTEDNAQYSENYIHALANKLRAFFNDLVRIGTISVSPMAKMHIKAERYGTPYYLTIEERNRIADFDLSAYPALAAQRDIFIFQCCIGCRVSDLLALTVDNVINGAIEYVPTKTKGESTRVVRVPLNERALSLVERYKGREDGRLMPFISSQKYNQAIKEICTLCGVTRMVTVYNSATDREERRPLNELASSHLARRTFIGNLYKRVKDPNLVGSMSGHSEGSRAFARYRDIDDDIKRELVGMIE